MAAKNVFRTFKTLSKTSSSTRLESTRNFVVSRAKKIGKYFHNIYDDYKVVAIETVQDMKARPIKASIYISAIGTVGFLMKTNPSEQDFKMNLMENTNDLSLVGQPVRSPKTEKYINFLQDNCKDHKLVYINLGVCSLIYEDNYSQDVDVYYTRCGKLKTRWLDFYQNIIDVGIIGRWINMDRSMVDYDINEDEWDENGNARKK